jgi:hypothetical protein
MQWGGTRKDAEPAEGQSTHPEVGQVDVLYGLTILQDFVARPRRELDEEAVQLRDVRQEIVDMRREREDGDVVQVCYGRREKRRVVWVLSCSQERA